MIEYQGSPEPLDPDQPCDDCELRAITQDDFDVPLCEYHWDEALAIEAADSHGKYIKENA